MDILCSQLWSPLLPTLLPGCFWGMRETLALQARHGSSFSLEYLLLASCWAHAEHFLGLSIPDRGPQRPPCLKQHPICDTAPFAGLILPALITADIHLFTPISYSRMFHKNKGCTLCYIHACYPQLLQQLQVQSKTQETMNKKDSHPSTLNKAKSRKFPLPSVISKYFVT